MGPPTPGYMHTKMLWVVLDLTVCQRNFPVFVKMGLYVVGRGSEGTLRVMIWNNGVTYAQYMHTF